MGAEIDTSFIGIFRYLVSGIITNLRVIPFVLIIGFFGGALLGTLRSLKIPVLDQILSIYIATMRGTPLLVALLVTFFSINFPSPFVAGVFVLGVYQLAYFTEIFKGGIQNLPRGQNEAGKAVAMNLFQRMRYIIFPQIFYSITRALVGQFILTIKGIPLLSAIGVQGMLYEGQLLMRKIYHPFKIFFVIAVFYFIICSLIKRFGDRIERRLEQRGLAN